MESGGEASPFLRYRLPDVVSPYGTLKTTAVYRHTCDIDVRNTYDTGWMRACIRYRQIGDRPSVVDQTWHGVSALMGPKPHVFCEKRSKLTVWRDSCLCVCASGGWSAGASALGPDRHGPAHHRRLRL